MITTITTANVDDSMRKIYILQKLIFHIPIEKIFVWYKLILSKKKTRKKSPFSAIALKYQSLLKYYFDLDKIALVEKQAREEETSKKRIVNKLITSMNEWI